MKLKDKQNKEFIKQQCDFIIQLQELVKEKSISFKEAYDLLSHIKTISLQEKGCGR